MVKRTDSSKKPISKFAEVMAPAILGSVTTLSVAYINLLAKDKAPTINIGQFSIPKEIQLPLTFIFALFLFSLTLLSIKKIIVKHRDSKQEPVYPLIGFVSNGDYKMDVNLGFDSNVFLFECEFSLSPNPYIQNVSGPFCSVDNNGSCGTKLREKKTFLGRYKHQCDSCGKVYTSNFSAWTLKKRAENVILSNIKKEAKLDDSKEKRFL